MVFIMLDKVFVLRNEENSNVAFNIENLESDRLSDREVLMLYEYYKSGRLNDCSPKVKEDIVRFNKKMYQTNIVSEPYDMPLSPTIVISHDCNYNCSYCFEKDFRKSGVITPEHINNIEAFLDIYSKHYGIEKKYGGISIVGGEPFLPSNMPIISTIHEHWKDQAFQYTTNGTNILMFSEILKRAKKLRLKISIDGTKQMHLAKRATNNSSLYNETIKGLKWAISSEIETIVLSVFHPDLLDSYPQYFDMLENLGWLTKSNLKLAFLLKMDSGCDDIDRKYILDVNKALIALKKNDSRINNASITKLIPGANALSRALISKVLGHKLTTYACEALFAATFTFAPDGCVYFCNATRSKQGRIGLFYPHVEVDFHMLDILKKRNVLNMSQCKNCKYRFVCGGGCPVSSIKHYGDVEHPFCSYWKDPEIIALFETVLA